MSVPEYAPHPNGGGEVHRGAVVESGAWVGSGAWVPARHRVFTVPGIGSRGATLTAYWCEVDGSAGVEFVTGCFLGTGEKLVAESEDTHGPPHHYTEEYRLAVALLTRLVERQHEEMTAQDSHTEGR